MRDEPDGGRDRRPVGENYGKRRSARLRRLQKIKVSKRHIDTDMQGNLVGLVVHSADIQDREGGYAGAKLNAAPARIGKWKLEIIKRSDRSKGIEVLPRS